jgi:hypothetical protein
MWHLSKNWHRCVFNICVSFGNWLNSQLSFYLHCRFLNSAVFSVILSKVLIWNIFFHLLLLEHFQIENFFFQMTMISWVTTSVGGKRNADFSQFSRESKSPSCRVEAKKHTDFSTKTTTAATKEQSKVSFRRMSDLYRDQKTVRMVSTSA